MGYIYPGLMAALVAQHLDNKDAEIIDIGAGTGLAAWYLSPLGYKNITALDMSQGMLDVAAKSGLYKTVQRDVLGEPLSHPDNAFDAAISSGTFTAKHAPADCFEEIFRIVKPGGLFIVSLRVDNNVSADYQAALGGLVDKGAISLIDQTEDTQAFLLPDDPEEAKVRGQIFVYRLA